MEENGPWLGIGLLAGSGIGSAAGFNDMARVLRFRSDLGPSFHTLATILRSSLGIDCTFYLNCFRYELI